MKIIFELTPSEMVSAAHNGSLQLFLENARKDENTMEQVKAAKEADQARAEVAAVQTEFTATAAPGPGVQMPGSNLPPVQTFAPTVSTPAAPAPTFNPTVAAPAAAPAGFDPMAFANPAPVAPAATNAPAAAPVLGQAPAAGQPSIDEVRAKIAPLIKAGKVAEMQALFAEFGAQKLTDVDPGNYAALIARAATI